MDQEHLAALLREVHAELEQGGTVDAETRRLLVTVLDDIDSALERPAPAAPEEHQTFVERLRTATWRLEETHPRLTNTISQLIDVLGRTIQ